MKLKDTANIISMALVVLFMAPAAGAMTVTLDAVENAGWWEENLEQSYLRILDKSGPVWSSENSQATWSSFADLVTDLSDGSIDNTSSPISLENPYIIQSGGDVFANATPIYKTIRLPAGQYKISLASKSAAYNLLYYDDPVTIYKGGDLWNAYVQMWTSEKNRQDLAFGNGDIDFFDSETTALEAHKMITTSLTLSEEAKLFLYINDNNSLDNTGSVTLNIQMVPLPAAWLLFGSGMAALVGGRRFRKNRIG